MFSTRCNILARGITTAKKSAIYLLGEPFINRADISTSAQCCDSNYYETLGIPQTSTQNDIKTAYYKLSMQFHPDKNKGSEEAAKRFREITQAYEVLGNYRLRRLYDKGIIHTAGTQFAQRSGFADEVAPDIEDDPETKFYKSRFRKSKVADEMGRTPIYDFDEWSRAHYGKSFNRRQEAKRKWDQKQKDRKMQVISIQNEIVLFGMVFVVMILYAIFYMEASYDTPKPRVKESFDKNEKKS